MVLEEALEEAHVVELALVLEEALMVLVEVSEDILEDSLEVI